MPPESGREAEFSAWLIKADRDLLAAPLSEYAWRFRYPGEPVEPSREEAESAAGLALEVLRAVLSRLPRNVHPEFDRG